MASHDMPHRSPVKYANERALRPGLIIAVVVVLLFIVALGKVQWARAEYHAQGAGFAELLR